MSDDARVACLWLPDFALQVHRRAHPELSAQKLAIVDRDHPLGKILEIEPGASSGAIHPGMRYSQALSLDLELCCVVWDPDAVAQAQHALAQACLDWTPDVECYPQEDGVIWLFYAGMQRLYPSVEQWGQEILTSVQAKGWQAKLAVGFKRRSSYAAVRCQSAALWVAPDRQRELQMAGALGLQSLALPSKDQKRCRDLGLYHLRELWALDAGSLPDRFGPELRQWHAMRSQDEWGAGERIALEKSTQCRIELEAFLKKSSCVMACIGEHATKLAESLFCRGYEISGIEIDFFIVATWGKAPAHQRHELVELALPGRDISALLRLIELRLQARPLSAAVERIDLRMRAARAPQRQGSLWGSLETRDLAQGEQALAVIRAELGNEAVQHAVLCDEHVPEQRFRWEPYQKLSRPELDARPKDAPVSGLVRRIERQAQSIKGGAIRPQAFLWGPYILESDWWSQKLTRKEYYLRDQKGFMRWVFFDGQKKRWFLQGAVG